MTIVSPKRQTGATVTPNRNYRTPDPSLTEKGRSFSTQLARQSNVKPPFPRLNDTSVWHTVATSLSRAWTAAQRDPLIDVIASLARAREDASTETIEEVTLDEHVYARVTYTAIHSVEQEEVLHSPMLSAEEIYHLATVDEES